MMRSLRVCAQFLYRDLYVFSSDILFYVSNYALIYPLCYMLTFAYLMPETVMANTEAKELFVLTMLSGNVVFLMINMSWKLVSPLLYDMESTKVIQFQMMHLHPYAVLFEHVLFFTCFSFCFLAPFFAVGKITLGDLLDISHINWPALLLMTLLGCLFTVTYCLCAVMIMKSSKQTGSFWVRFTIPLTIMGGFWVSWHTADTFWPLLGRILLANPFIYATEGIRRAVTGSDTYFSIPLCAVMLTIFSLAFFTGACWFMRKKLDPVL